MDLPCILLNLPSREYSLKHLRRNVSAHPKMQQPRLPEDDAESAAAGKLMKKHVNVTVSLKYSIHCFEDQVRLKRKAISRDCL